MNKFYSILFSLCFFVGCSNIQIAGDDSPELLKVTEVFNSIENKEDKLLIHKMFSGAGEYLSNCKSMDGTQRFDPILGKVQSSYGWDREKYPEFTDVVSEYLVSVGYDEPKKLDSDQSRKDFAKIFQDLAEATKHE